MNTLTNVTTENATSLDTIGFLDLLVDVTKSTACSIEYVVDDTTSKTINKKVSLQKHVLITHAFLNHDYTKKVQNLTGNKDFQAEELKGKKRISPTIIKSLKTEKYLLDLKILNKETVKILGYFFNGESLTKEQAKARGLFKSDDDDDDKEKTTSGRGTVSLEDDFKMITLGLDGIYKTKIFGKKYNRKIEEIINN